MQMNGTTVTGGATIYQKSNTDWKIPGDLQYATR
jgi:hypothetical protein